MGCVVIGAKRNGASLIDTEREGIMQIGAVRESAIVIGASLTCVISRDKRIYLKDSLGRFLLDSLGRYLYFTYEDEE